MEPEILRKQGFLIVGVRSVWNFDARALKILWKEKALPRRREIKAAPDAGDSAFGVFGAIPDNRDGLYEYVAGFPVSSLEDIPTGMVGWEIPEGLYASAPATGLDNIFPVCKELTDVWLPASGYRRADSPVFTVSASAVDPADPAARWLVNVRIEKAGSEGLELDSWAAE